MRVTASKPSPSTSRSTKNFGGSTYSVLKRSTVITRMRTDDGLVSEVYNGDNREHGARDRAPDPGGARAPREGHEHPRGRAHLGGDVRALHTSRDRKTLLEAIACVDCALLGPRGQGAGPERCALLGGYRDGCPSSHRRLLHGGQDARRHRPRDGAYRAAGMAGCKFKVGGLTPEEDAKRVEAARGRPAPDFILAVDANRGWYAADAIASRAWSSRSTSAGSRSRATGTTTRP